MKFEMKEVTYISAEMPIAHNWRCVWDCERCVELRNTVWLDSVRATYGQWKVNSNGIITLNADGSGPFIETIQAKKIVILLDEKVAFVNPIELPEVNMVMESMRAPRPFIELDKARLDLWMESRRAAVNQGIAKW